MRNFAQVDVFTKVPYRGNPLAVVLDATGMSNEEMARFANWTNLSETTFLLPPIDPAADYRVRIFTPSTEYPFAGHPTIGSCHAWLEAGGVPKGEHVIQECGAGLVPLRRNDGRLAFAAPPLLRGGPLRADELSSVCAALRIEEDAVIDSNWVDNGPGWAAVLLNDTQAVLDVVPDFAAAGDFAIGVVGIPKIGVVARDGVVTGDGVGLVVRALYNEKGDTGEDPVTGSLNASVAQWLLSTGRIEAPYVASQGTTLGRDGRVYIEAADGEVWVGGDSITCISGTVDL